MPTSNTARSVFSAAQIIGWIVIGAAIAAFAIIAPHLPTVTALGVTAPTALGGLALIVLAQIGFTNIATAANTAEIARLLTKEQPQSNAYVAGGRAPGTIKVYKGRQIERSKSGQVVVDGVAFANVIDAEKAISSGAV